MNYLQIGEAYYRLCLSYKAYLDKHEELATAQEAINQVARNMRSDGDVEKIEQGAETLQGIDLASIVKDIRETSERLDNDWEDWERVCEANGLQSHVSSPHGLRMMHGWRF